MRASLGAGLYVFKTCKRRQPDRIYYTICESFSVVALFGRARSTCLRVGVESGSLNGGNTVPEVKEECGMTVYSAR